MMNIHGVLLMAGYMGRLLLIILLLFACNIFNPVFSFAASPAGAETISPPIRVISPPNATFVTEGKLFLAGVLEDETTQQINIEGVKLDAKNTQIPVEGRAFGVFVILKTGENIIKLKTDKAEASIKIYFLQTESNKPITPPQGYTQFFVHKNQTPLTCKECHRYKRGAYDFKRVIPAQSNCTTPQCHANFGKKLKVHGPVGAGVCVSCHNPHGSALRFELQRKGKDLCLVCHMTKQEEFAQAVVHAPVKDGCVTCHDPHESDMKFQLRGDGKAVSSLCFKCHEGANFTKEHRHGPVGAGDCIACHQPHASANPKLLIAKQAQGEVCFQCHKDRKSEFTMKQVHQPVEDDCGKCHDPHSSANRFQLVKPTGQLCNSCHERLSPKVYNDIKTAQFKHKPVDEGRCADCHRVHSSNYPPLLKNSLEKLCLSCHVDLGDQLAESKFKHGPVQTGDCTGCHKTHGAQFTKLLSRYFPMNFYSEYNPDYYDLCFGCHNKEIAKKKFTTTLTNFRDGNYNLHFFHVNMKKGRTCTSCHDAHSSSQAKHIRLEVPFGTWSYPIDFTKTDIGGTCVVGCHAPKTYDRKNPKITTAK